jgi:hypothetical protein
MSNNAKDIRKQVRNVVQEILPELLASALIAEIDKKLTALVLKRLDQIDQRQKDIQGYMVRQSASSMPTKAVD